ncbi:DNA uptake protein ComE-like DNA-binding protein [Algoriphagus boseongensis]|uniref:DNA uptake protein ComE-like DNA-binding protein n=1 Tax=Algoriphagus boseongensis TaxID=1442587 RepID=A0A4R6T9V0_9BACT|nr:helix-hairpin-helix domain-containing protein [Algoriphagus boseongensis]TDQ18355.1 DNA uptake protein ComE-like DNA-binding protein [Algoriphagus boseongensis]
MSKFYFFLKTYLGFTSKESRGFLLLIPFLVILSLAPPFIRYLKNQEAEVLYQEYQAVLDSLDQAGFTLVSSPLPTFNPADTAKVSKPNAVSERIQKIPFSEADSIVLQIVPGIGPTLAGRIVKTREAMGGFYSQSQLLEIYGLTEETALKVWDYFDFDPKVFIKIPINQVGVEDLAKHPYISYSEAKVIIAFRNQHGPFQTSEDLLKIKIFKKEWVDKISPYLQFD